MPKTHVRVLGGGNTYVCIGLGKAKKVEFLSQLTDTPGTVIGRTTPIQGIGDAYPVEIATGYAQGAGSLTLRVWQTWEKDGWVSAFMSDDGTDGGIWDQFMNNNATFKYRDNDHHYPVDIYEVLTAQRMNTEYISVQKIEKGANGQTARIKSYEGCVITDISAAEDITNDKMDNIITITMAYTKVNVTYTDNIASLELEA